MQRRSFSTGGLVSPASGQCARNGASYTKNVPKFFTIEQVAERLDVSPRTVRRWITAGALPVHRFGRLVRVSETDLAAFLALNRDA